MTTHIKNSGKLKNGGLLVGNVSRKFLIVTLQITFKTPERRQ